LLIVVLLDTKNLSDLGEMIMIFLCMGYFNPKKMDARPRAEIEAVMSECQPHIEKFYDSGKVLLDAGLESETKSLRRVNGKVIVTDGPFTETKEMIGSIFIFEAESMDEAIQLASLHPTTQVSKGEEFDWRIEIRPVHYFKNDK
jgi:hypothetical protein